jgi:integrase
VDRLDRFEVERLIQAAYRTHSRRGLMIKPLFLTGARVSEFAEVRVEDLHLDSDPPQIRHVHAKGGASRYVPILPSHIDPELASLALLGPIFYRRLMSSEPFNPGRANELIDMVLGGLSASPGSLTGPQPGARPE